MPDSIQFLNNMGLTSFAIRSFNPSVYIINMIIMMSVIMLYPRN